MAESPTLIPTRDPDRFSRALPGQLAMMGRRMAALNAVGWDINGLQMLHEQARLLTQTAQALGLEPEALPTLAGVERIAAPCVEAPRLPDEAEAASLADLAQRLGATLRTAAARVARAPAAAVGDAGRIEAPPAGFWRQWAADAAPPVPLVAEAVAVDTSAPVIIHELSRADATEPPALVVADDDELQAADALVQAAGTAGDLAPAPPRERMIEARDPTAAPEAQPEPDGVPAAASDDAPEAAGGDPDPAPPPDADANEPSPAQADENLRVYHLTDGSGLGCEIDQAMEAAGWEIEVLADDEELRELLAALPPDLVLIDAAFLESLEETGAVLRATRQRTGVRIPLAAIVEADELATRLLARRAGVDALLIDPSGAAEVLKSLRELLAPPAEAPFRILIVEDDASQALFAESILRNANMQTEVVDDPFDVLPALERFMPDMVLMDLHMPKCNGMELTALIRENPAFLHLPIVFLSGESDQDMQFEALDAGGDDFIAKPVRPRHLISSVQNRVRRSRAVARRGGDGAGVPAPAPPSSDNGRIDRSSLMARINAALAASDQERLEHLGLLFLEVDSSAQLRERLGLSNLEQLLEQAAEVIVGQLGETGLVCRFGDASFLALVKVGDDEGLARAATPIRQALGAHSFQVDGTPIRLRFSIGACGFDRGFGTSGDLLNAVERACREARADERGIKVHIPPQRPEAAREAAMLEKIRAGIQGDGFELVYQPIVAVAGGDEVQYQTLLRMRGEDGRLLPAGELIPVAERHELIVDVDRWVLGTAMRMITEQNGQGRSTSLFVPQSVNSLRNDSHAPWLVEQLGVHALPASAIVVEVRMDDALVHESAVADFCRAAADAGVRVCLSRFEGNDQAARLVESLPLSFVKMAHKYVAADAEQSLRDELRELINLAHGQNVQVIGHRVEDANAAATLWMSGIDYIQGNLVQRVDASMAFDFQTAVL